MIVRHLHSQWKSWIDEFFSDLFACYTLGPAYAWAHLHLTTKKSDDIYRFEKPPVPQSHPSDDSRMKILEIGLEEISFSNEAKEILSVWKRMPFATSSRPIHEYQYAYPNLLMKKIAKLILKGIERSEISTLTPERLDGLDTKSIRKMLNEAWNRFWLDSRAFREWETETLDSIKSI